MRGAARAGSAVLTHGFVDACREGGVRFTIGLDLTAPIRTACLAVPAGRWVPAITADGSDERDGVEVAELTNLVETDTATSRETPQATSRFATTS